MMKNVFDSSTKYIFVSVIAKKFVTMQFVTNFSE